MVSIEATLIIMIAFATLVVTIIATVQKKPTYRFSRL